MKKFFIFHKTQCESFEENLQRFISITENILFSLFTRKVYYN